MPNYGDPVYWDDRYKKAGTEGAFDWLESYETLKGLLDQFMGSFEMRILVLGCGNAEFSEDLYDAGYHNIVNVDISSVVIEQMNERNNEKRPGMVYQVMDICDMREFESNSFDMAIDKSTIDALLCGDDSFLKVAQMLKETQRVLKTDGVYFAISYGKPESRSFHFVQPFLSFENREFILYDPACTTEEESIAIATGAWLGGMRSVAMMQSSGVGNCINMLSLPVLTRSPLLMVVTMRGEWGEFNPWQVPMSRATEPSLQAIGIRTLRVDEAADVAPTMEQAMTMAFDADQQIAVLLSQRLLGAKTW